MNDNLIIREEIVTYQELYIEELEQEISILKRTILKQKKDIQTLIKQKHDIMIKAKKDLICNTCKNRNDNCR